MKAKFKRKNYYLDQNKIRRVRAILRQEDRDRSNRRCLKPGSFQKRNSQVTAKSCGRGGVEKVL